MQKPNAIIFDLDGTLCNVEHRLHLLPDFDAFHTACVDDTLNRPIAELFWAMKQRGWFMIIVTGRDDNFRIETHKWLYKNHIQYDVLIMRPHGNHRSDVTLKEKIYLTEIKPFYDVSFCVDDRKGVTAKWRELGVVCLQCKEGNY